MKIYKSAQELQDIKPVPQGQVDALKRWNEETGKTPTKGWSIKKLEGSDAQIVPISQTDSRHVIRLSGVSGTVDISVNDLRALCSMANSLVGANGNTI